MSFSRWLRNLQSACRLGTATGSGRLAARPPTGGTLPAAVGGPGGARTVPSTLTVTSALDDGSSGTLRTAIAAASGDTIQFSNQLQGHTITLTSGQLAITKSLDIEGPGANKVIVSGNNASRVFKITGAGTTVTIAGLTIANGQVVANGGGGIRNGGGLGVGGGVYNLGVFGFDLVTAITGNHASTSNDDIFP